jgi:hypothetical protein
MEVADHRRLIEAVLLAQSVDFGGVHSFALGAKFGYVTLEIIARRQFDDRENQR